LSISSQCGRRGADFDRRARSDAHWRQVTCRRIRLFLACSKKISTPLCGKLVAIALQLRRSGNCIAQSVACSHAPYRSAVRPRRNRPNASTLVLPASGSQRVYRRRASTPFCVGAKVALTSQASPLLNLKNIPGVSNSRSLPTCSCDCVRADCARGYRLSSCIGLTFIVLLRERHKFERWRRPNRLPPRTSHVPTRVAAGAIPDGGIDRRTSRPPRNFVVPALGMERGPIIPR